MAKSEIESESNGRNTRKRNHDESEQTAADHPQEEAATSDSEDEIGPMPIPNTNNSNEGPESSKKKRKVLPHQSLLLSQLPCTDRYQQSFMHRDSVNFVTLTPNTNFLITTSIDGHVKFWKKMEFGIEFVKHYRAHLSIIVGCNVSADGAFFATIAADGSAKIFDVVNFGE